MLFEKSLRGAVVRQEAGLGERRIHCRTQRALAAAPRRDRIATERRKTRARNRFQLENRDVWAPIAITVAELLSMSRWCLAQM